jgi:hypothetical protein
MLDFILSQFLFYFAIVLVLFVPGYALIYALFGKKWPISSLEAFFISFGLSIVSVNFIMLFLGKINLPLTRWSLFFSLLLLTLICGAIYLKRWKKNEASVKLKELALPVFSRVQLVAVILLLLLTFFIKTVYLKDTILPTSTDLGHHMYWAKTISVSGKIPVYAKVNIDMESNKLTEPQPIADFIIGEHLIFSAINLVSGIDYISYFPSLILFLVHLMAILAMFSLTRLFFKDYTDANTIAIATLFFIGPLYALASPQAKFVSGGVIGNVFGNFFIPLCLYFFLRALMEKSSLMLALGLFVSLGMAYTHHLSTFIFIFIFIFSGLFFLIFNFRELKKYFRDWQKILFKPAPLVILAIGVIFVFLIYTPTYLNTKAIDTAVGAPSKATRAGLTFDELSDATGKIRMALGLFGLALLFLAKKYKSYAGAFLLGWALSLVAISLWPNLLFVDIPSDRIANYIVFPFSLLSGFTFVYFFDLLKDSEAKKQYLNPTFVLTAFLLLFTFLAMNGLRENASTLNTDVNVRATLETYHASTFLAQKTTTQDIVLKDHNYLPADSWMKLYFMRGYTYPLSRGYFKRYDDVAKMREQCTNLMISTPSDPIAKDCFSKTQTNFLMLNPKFDSMQFVKLKNFWKIYSADDLVIFYKNN